MHDVTIATEIGTLLVLAALVVVAAHGWPGEAGVDAFAGRVQLGLWEVAS